MGFVNSWWCVRELQEDRELLVMREGIAGGSGTPGGA